MLRDILLDISAVNAHPVRVVLSNRGFHALLFYRLAHWLYLKKIPILPLILTRIIQIIYAIDIDWRAKIHGGVTIVHGVGLVIGAGVVIGTGTKIYHGVTIGIAESGRADGFPNIGRNVMIGAGAKLLGPIKVGNNAKIGANAVVLQDVPDNGIAVGVPAKIVSKKEERTQ